jgi:hypothetical protein
MVASNASSLGLNEQCYSVQWSLDDFYNAKG